MSPMRRRESIQKSNRRVRLPPMKHVSRSPSVERTNSVNNISGNGSGNESIHGSKERSIGYKSYAPSPTFSKRVSLGNESVTDNYNKRRKKRHPNRKLKGSTDSLDLLKAEPEQIRFDPSNDSLTNSMVSHFDMQTSQLRLGPTEK